MHVRNLRFYQTMQFVLDLLAVTAAWSCTIQMRVLLNPLATQRVILDLCIDLGALIDDGPGVVDRHGLAPQVLSR
jgi:hypothetical protein